MEMWQIWMPIHLCSGRISPGLQNEKEVECTRSHQRAPHTKYAAHTTREIPTEPSPLPLNARWIKDSEKSGCKMSLPRKAKIQTN